MFYVNSVAAHLPLFGLRSVGHTAYYKQLLYGELQFDLEDFLIVVFRVICTKLVGSKDVARPQVDGCLALWRIWYRLLKRLLWSAPFLKDTISSYSPACRTHICSTFAPPTCSSIAAGCGSRGTASGCGTGRGIPC